jgi:hypothetical protein
MLLVSGCSYTEDKNSWARVVSDYYKRRLVNIGSGMSGNSFIAKSIINEISNQYLDKPSSRGRGDWRRPGHLLKEKDLVVGIMWSEVIRKDILINRDETVEWDLLTQEKTLEKFPANDRWYQMTLTDKLTYRWDPRYFKTIVDMRRAKRKMAWTLASSNINNIWLKSGGRVFKNAHVDSKRKVDEHFWEYWYKKYYTYEGMFWETLENILRTQWFLEKYSVPYFMTSMNDLFTEGLSKHKDLKYLYDLIDMNRFCLYDGTKGIWEHNEENGYPLDETHHPTKEGHQAFCADIILPKLKEIL